MQRSRPATRASSGVGRGTASSGKATTGAATNARPRTASEKASAETTAGLATRASKPVTQKAKAPAVSAPAAHKRALTSTQSKAGAVKPAAAVNNQEEQPQQDEGNDVDQRAADAASVCSTSNTSDAAAVGWLIGSDYRLVTAVRVRPMLPAEKKKGYRRIVDMAPPDEGGWTRIVNPLALTSPLSPPPAADGESQVVSLPPPPPASKHFTHEFAFDYSFWSYDHAAGRQVATQSVVYESLGALAIETVLQGSNCAILAYGQAGTGKTFTMTGGAPGGKATSSTVGSSSRVTTSRATTRAVGAASSGPLSSAGGGASRRGLTPRICRGLFDRLDELQQDFGDKSAVHVSFVEVYNERVYDLLLTPANAKRAQEPLKVREHPEQGTYVENARQVKASTFEAVQALLEEGNRQRSVVSTTANGRSSRSHAVLTLTLTHQTPPPLSAGKEGHTATVKKSKLYLVDLAGSERADTTETDSSRQRETSSINRSLSTLADVISALAKRSIGGCGAGGSNTSSSIPFVPYRNSVLTRLLKESLGGDATTVLLATISPCCAHFEDTLSTLKFVGRAKIVLSVPKLPSPSPSLLEPAAVAPSEEPLSGIKLVHDLRKEILELKEKLEASPPASETRRPSFPLALSWESPSPDAAYSGVENAFHGCSGSALVAGGGDATQCADGDMPSSAIVDAVADATRWALQYAPSPMLDEHSVPHQLDDNEKARLEEELAELKATLSKKEYDFECQRVTTRALQDRVAAQILSQHLILSNLLSIRRRWLQLQAMRAFQRWRTNAQGTISHEKHRTHSENAKIQTNSPMSAGRNRSPPPAAQLDALCHSVVGNFVFTADEQAQNNELSLQNERQLAVDEYDEAQQQAMDCNTLSIIIDGFGENSDLEGGSPPDEYQEDGEVQGSAPSTDCAGGLSTEKQQCIEMKLAACLDSIDLARKAMGPTLRRLRQMTASSPTTACLDDAGEGRLCTSTGAERSLLMNLDTRLVTLNQIVEAMRDGLAQRNMCTVNHGVAATAVFELMEALVSAFCLHMLGRVNDQLVSGVSGCALGRQEIESQLRAFREQLAQLVQLANAVMARGELHPRDHDVILLLVVELVSVCERIECVWLAIEQRKRHQLVNRRISIVSSYELGQLSAKLQHMETNSRALDESMDAQVLETARIEDELATATEQIRSMEETHVAQVAALEIQLAECEARASELEKSNVDMSSTAKTQTSRIEQLEQQLAELSRSFQALHDAQDGSTTGDETSPITLRCGNLMVRLEEELTSALYRMNAMDATNENAAAASPLSSERASPSASPLMKEYDLQLAAINHELSELAAETPIEQQAQSPSHRSDDSPSNDEDVGKAKAVMERDLLAASAHEHELETQLAEALAQVCLLQAQHESLVGSVHSLNCELSEALGRVASLEDEREHPLDDNAVDAAAQLEDQRLIALADAQSALVEMDRKLAAAMEQLAATEKQNSAFNDTERSKTASYVSELQQTCEHYKDIAVSEQARCQQAEAERAAEFLRWEESERMHQTTVSVLNSQLELAVGDLGKTQEHRAAKADELRGLRRGLEASEADRETVESSRADLASQLAKEQARCQELTRQVEAAVEHLTELRGQAGTLRADLESALHCKQQWEAQTQEKDAVITSQAAQLSHLEKDKETLATELEREKDSRRMLTEEAEEQALALRATISHLTERIRSLQVELIKAEASGQQHEARVGSLEGLIAFKTATAEALTERLDKVQADSRTELERLSQSLSEKVSEVDDAEERYADLLGVSAAERDQLASLRTELTHCNAKVNALEKTLGDSRRQASVELKGREEAAAKLRGDLEKSSETVRALKDQLMRVGAEHKAATGAAEQQIADLQGETDLLRLLLRTQQRDAVKDQAELEETRAALGETTAALTAAVAELGQANARLLSLESCRVAQSTRTAKLEARNAEITRQLAAVQDASTSSSEWKQAWSRSIVRCGALKIQLSAEAIERRRLELELLRKDDVVKQIVIDPDAMKSELRTSDQAKLALEIKYGSLVTDVEQHRGQLAGLREQISSFEARERQRDAEYMELQLFLDLAEKKQKLQSAVEQRESDLQARNAEHAAVMEGNVAREQGLEAHGAERVAELEAMLVSQTADAREQIDRSHEKETELLKDLDQANGLVEELKVRVLESERQLEGERAHVQALKQELQTCQEDIAQREASERTLHASVGARDDAIAAQAAQIERASVECQALTDECTRLDKEIKDLATQCEDLREQADHAHEWKQAWSRSIAECGALQLQVATVKAEVLELDHALASAVSWAKAQNTEVALLRSELQRALGISSGMETVCAELQVECHLRESRLSEAQTELRALTLRAQQSESELLRLELELRDSEEQKQALQEQVGQSVMRVCELETELATTVASHTAFAQQLQARHLSKEQKLEQAITLASQNVIEQALQWQEKEAALRAEAADADDRPQRLASKVCDVQRQLEKEQEKACKLSVEIGRPQTELAEREASNHVMWEQIAQQNDIIASLKSTHEKAAAQRQSLEEQCDRLQTDFAALAAEKREVTRQIAEQSARFDSECAAAAASAVERTSQRLGEAEATALMQLAELESVRWWIAVQPEGFRRRSSSELLDQAVAAYNLEPSEEAKRAMMQHLSSLDEWFEKTIVGGLPDDVTSSSFDASPAIHHVQSAPVNFPAPVVVETTPVDLETLTNELLELCSTVKSTELSRTDTLETIRVPSATEVEDVEEEEEEETTVSTEIEDVFGESVVPRKPATVDDNNAVDGGDLGASEAEVAQLKSTIWRLKEALDAKDDMLGFMDEKLSYYEQLHGKKNQSLAQQQQQQQQRRGSRSMAPSSRR